MTYSSCLHDQQDFCWGNNSRDTSEESQESQEKHSKPASIWVKMKWLKMRLPNHLSEYVTNEKWPKESFNK